LSPHQFAEPFDECRLVESILTSNQSLGAWGEVFGDPVIATAILDRLLHHSITVNIKGDSYRLREKLKASLLKSRGTETTDAAQGR
jgi:IstB-like ATP binding protein